jgi:hypothetical protein
MRYNSIIMDTFMRKLPTKYSWHVLVAIILVVQLICIGYLGWSVHNLNYRQQLMALNTYSQFNSQARTHAVTVDDGASVALTALHIKLPRNKLTKDLVYEIRQTYTEAGGYTDDFDIAPGNVPLTATSPNNQISCAAPVRIKFETKATPYNPHESTVASVRLADGRTLHAYAFTHPDCTPVFSNYSVSPTELGEVFKAAQSY